MGYEKKSRERHTVKQRARGDGKAMGFSDILKGSALGALATLIFALVLSTVGTVVCLFLPEPLTASVAAGLAVLYISASVGGFFGAWRLRQDRPSALLSGGLCGLAVFVVFGITALLVKLFGGTSAIGLSDVILLILRFLVIVCAILGSAMTNPVRSHRPRKHRRR